MGRTGRHGLGRRWRGLGDERDENLRDERDESLIDSDGVDWDGLGWQQCGLGRRRRGLGDERDERTDESLRVHGEIE